jgi:hypothetical protein
MKFATVVALIALGAVLQATSSASAQPRGLCSFQTRIARLGPPPERAPFTYCYIRCLGERAHIVPGACWFGR